MVAVLLVFHGSRDQRPQQGMCQLVNRMQVELDHHFQRCLVHAAQLELGELPLVDQLYEFAMGAGELGLDQVYIFPLFLLAGNHVMDDIPLQVKAAAQRLGQQFNLIQMPHLGSFHGFVQLMQTQMRKMQSKSWILLAHGSRRSGGNQPVIELAIQLNATPAFWVIPPSMEMQINQLILTGCSDIGVIPYFMFPGRILTTIAHRLIQLKTEFPTVNLEISNPVSANPELAKLLVKQVIQFQQKMVH